MIRKPHEPVTEERLERALAYMAFVVMQYGPVYQPIFDRLEKELIEFRRNNNSIEERLRRLSIGTPKNVQHNVQHQVSAPTAKLL